MTAEKITVTIPNELKERLVSVKDEMKISMSAIYKEALESYLEKKELEKWEKGASLASKDKEYKELSKELGSFSGEVYEY
jgi:post-segregation antitoxin (ccd killing protein)